MGIGAKKDYSLRFCMFMISIVSHRHLIALLAGFAIHHHFRFPVCLINAI
jgi:hypothetical protein